MKKILCSSAVALLTAPAAFSFAHLWDIREAYTTLDGSVQFVEFFTTSSSEGFLTFAKLFSTGAPTLLYDHDLPGSTAGKTYLVGTANLGSLYGVTPDFTISAGFLTKAVGNIVQNQDTGSNPLDTVRLDNLPTDGVQSLNGVIGNDSPTVTSINSQATPRNFAGQTATIPEPATAALLLLGSAFAGLRRRRAA